MSCFIVGCSSKKRKGQKLSFFTVPKNELKTWQNAIPQQGFSQKDLICELHFKEEDILREWVHTINGQTVRIKRDRTCVKKGSIPTVFSNSEDDQNSTNEISLSLEYNDDMDSQYDIQNVHYDDKKNTFLRICEDYKKNPAIISWVPTSFLNQTYLAFRKFGRYETQILKAVVIHDDMTVNAFIGDDKVSVENILREIRNIDDVKKLVDFLDQEAIKCHKIDKTIKSDKCLGYVIKKNSTDKGRQIRRCFQCNNIWRRIAKRKSHEADKQAKCDKRKSLLAKRKTSLEVRLKRSHKKNEKLKQIITDIKNKCARANKEALEKAIINLPRGQQDAVLACFNAAKITDKRCIRYTNDWVYECLLLRIKSSKAYTHLRTHNLLAVPSVQTLQRYIRKIKGIYGYNEGTLQLLKKKTDQMKPEELRGVLLVDEMKLTKSLSFNKETLKIEGFTDLGKWTPEHQKNEKGDHALVIMFQPFRGSWVQTLGCFLSKGCAVGSVLHKVLAEGIILAERAGLKVDGIVSDGASWNRTMWNLFGVTEERVSVPHVADQNRKLWFFSDFPHLIKCLRNFFSSQDRFNYIWTPDGPVCLKHWYYLVNLENQRGFQLKLNFKLREEHIRPQYYQKMNVAMAFQFFGVADEMETLKEQHPGLNDCEGTVKFCRRVKKLITAMNSRTPLNSLKSDDEMWESIKEFLEFLEKWKKEKADDDRFIPESTYYGLKISLKAVLELSSFLFREHNYKYVMTSRLNQDNLERFFSMMRHACGSNEHPDSILFIQMYKLMSTYSLIKPPKGANTTGGEMVNALIELKDIDDSKERWTKFCCQLDKIVDSGIETNAIEEAGVMVKDHSYFDCNTSDFALAYIAGYVARRSYRFVNFKDDDSISHTCENCMAALVLKETDTIPDCYKYINLKSKGFLTHPSLSLFNLISELETVTLNTLKKTVISADLLFRITLELENNPPASVVGCKKHKKKLVHSVISFYLTMRMFFIAKQMNKNDNIEREMTKNKRKISKLATAPSSAEEKKRKRL